MKQDLFTHLPKEMTINILSRLPIITIMMCKCVCKSWLDLLETREFLNSHVSKSDPGLAVFLERESSYMSSKYYRFYDFVDELDPEYSERYCTVFFSLNFPHPEPIHSSVNGLLLLFNHNKRPHNLLVCNPLTLEYIKLLPPQLPSTSKLHFNTYGFGVSKKTSQYKLIKIFNELRYDQESEEWRARDQPECQVYTLGTGSWRSSIAPSDHLLEYEDNSIGAFLNGNLHWLVYDHLKGSPWIISCFDLETERFSTFSPPRLHGHHSSRTLTSLEKCLCLCDNSSDDEIVIWLMNEYGDENSWTKIFIIGRMSPDEFRGVLCPIKVFKDDVILIATELSRSGLLCYYKKTQILEERGVIKLDGYYCTSVVSYAPNLLSLETFTLEKVVFF